MVMERQIGGPEGVTVLETLKLGKTLAGTLAEELRIPPTVGSGFLRRQNPHLDELPRVPYFFEEVKIIQQQGFDPRSPKEGVKPWVVAVGTVAGSEFLIVNDKIVVAAPLNSLTVEKVDYWGNGFQGLWAKRFDDNGDAAILRVDRNGQVKTYLEGSREIRLEGSEYNCRFYRVTQKDDYQRVYYVDDEGCVSVCKPAEACRVVHNGPGRFPLVGRTRAYLLALLNHGQTRFESVFFDLTDGVLSEEKFVMPEQMDPEKINILAESSDGSRLLWNVQRAEGDSDFYLNDQPMGRLDNYFAWQADKELSQILLVGRKGEETVVYSNGQEAYRGKYAFSGSKYFEDARLGLVLLSDPDTQNCRLLFVTPERVALSEELVKVNLESAKSDVKDGDSSVVVEVRRMKDGPLLEWRFPLAS